MKVDSQIHRFTIFDLSQKVASMLRHLHLVFLIIPLLGWAQGHEEEENSDPGETSMGVNQQIWLDYNPNFEYSERLTLYGEAGFRTIFPNEWYRFIVSANARLKIKPLFLKKGSSAQQVHGGLRIFYTWNRKQADGLEARLFQGFRVDLPDGDIFNFRHYLRLEERFEFGFDGRTTVGLRFRYQLTSRLDFLFEWTKIPKKLYFPVSIEFFFNLVGTRQFNDVIRITPGAGYVLNENWRVQFDLSYHNTRDGIEEGFTTNDIVFRLRVHHRWKKLPGKKIPVNDLE